MTATTQMRDEATTDAGWHAHLSLTFSDDGNRTSLVRSAHRGPLRVQRAFYPEGPGCPHVYVLHPPGGLVPGDRLGIEVAVGAGARALVTTPAAGKVYRVGGRALAQAQCVSVEVAAGGCLEWLPQDGIVFDGADVALHNRFDLRGDARLIAWDVITLGRRAGDLPFDRGRVDQRFAVWRDGRPLWLERLHAVGGDALLGAPWGLGGLPVYGTLLATGQVSAELLQALRELAPEHVERRWAVTQLPELLVARYLGLHGREALGLFERAWVLLRPVLLDRDAVAPRIWST
jgi:urease accessory protein